MARDHSKFESLALRAASTLGDVLLRDLSPRLIKTRGLGPIIFVCLPRNTRTAADLFQATDHVVYGVYAFGYLVTRFHAATALLAAFPNTLESTRIQSMREETRRLGSRIGDKQNELYMLCRRKHGIWLER
mmetsp:Transcript_12387/g.35008  ORF Transcript_12387/g.35008 Transcript_12387/m.35008 type:complete len:131 (-) Transcript_12387:139-531(-)